MNKFAALGEVMLELAPHATTGEPQSTGVMGTVALSFAGDTYNTAVYLSRLGVPMHYITRVGDDIYSNQLFHQLEAEAIDAALVERVPSRTLGLYSIQNDAQGERQFTYWRGESPARELCRTPEAIDALVESLRGFSGLYFSGITLAIIGDVGRKLLTAALPRLRQQGVQIAFDSNYRPRLWSSREAAQAAIMAVMPQVDIALLTQDDERMLWGEGSIAASWQRYHATGLDELVLKCGADEVIIFQGGRQQAVPVPAVAQVIDTTGAGDSFNAGYLAARWQGATAEAAAQQGIRCARIVIQHRGAVIPPSVFQTAWQSSES